ncbi:MAG: type II secretion system protein [Desulfobacteraceae bacterium]|nr:MAG: type II secretion system protein [Desulfobacteraceae bacterium]
MRRTDRGPQGFTYISALVFVTIMGIGLSTAGGFWSTVVKREREQELLFRGDQIVRAIDSYYRQTPRNRPPEYPKSLQELLKDTRHPAVRRHLRRAYRNPLSKEGAWEYIMDKRGAIRGVYANSREEPAKKGRFPAGYERFEKATVYSEWQFIHEPKSARRSVPRPAGTPSVSASTGSSSPEIGMTE